MRQTTLAVLSLLTLTTALTGCGGDMVLLNSAGEVAAGQSRLMMTSIYVMLLVVIPSIIMALWFGWKYRKDNKDADYQPSWTHSTTIEVVVWGIPVIIILFLAYITWKGTHAYDPYKSRSADPSQDLVIQVVAEQFKWIFIYPEQKIATVNELRFPVDQPVSFRITSNFTMNSFFIPKLAGQIYAMAGMQTQLHMVSNKKGEFRGFSSNYSGYGFSQMRFIAHSIDQSAFDQWIATIKNGEGNTVIVDGKGTTAIQKGLLDQAELATLRDGNRSAKQIAAMQTAAFTEHDKKAAATALREGAYKTQPHPVTYYSSVEDGLFQSIIDKFMSNPDNDNEAAKLRQDALNQAPVVEAPSHATTTSAEQAPVVTEEATATAEQATATATAGE